MLVLAKSLCHRCEGERTTINPEHLSHLAHLRKPGSKIEPQCGLVGGQHLEIKPFDSGVRQYPFAGMGQQRGAKPKPAVIAMHPHAKQAAVLGKALRVGPEIDVADDLAIRDARDPRSPPAGSANGNG